VQTPHAVEEDQRAQRGTEIARPVDEHVEQAVRQLRDERRAPVAVKALSGHGLVEQRLAGGIGHRSDQIDQGASERPGWGQHPFAVSGIAVVAEDEGHDRDAGLRLGQEPEVRLGLVGQPGAEVAIEASYRSGLIERKGDDAAEHLADRMETVLEGGHHPEVASAAA
jgi:hypothetical protein